VQTSTELKIAPFTSLIDLAAERVGGKAIAASDEFFAPKENLLKTGRGVFIPDKYTTRGKWMDGWESRRKRVPGHDWCVIQLGLPGIIRGVDIDTNHFLGNHPTHASLDVATLATRLTSESFKRAKVDWREILVKSPLQPGSQNLFAVRDDHRRTHVRLNIYPDGGVARLRVYGEVLPDWNRYRKNQLIDLAAVQNGGMVLTCNDMFFGPKDNLIMPGRSKNMGDGWETKRKREAGYDWVILKLGARGILKKIEVDTNHFKGNFPDQCSIEGLDASELRPGAIADPYRKWEEVLPKTKLKGHTRHFFMKQIRHKGPFTHVRLNIFPDGGISRLRLCGVLV
jgi:allantoicase